MFWDEFGFSFQEQLAATWARRGKRPVFRRVSKERRALSTAVALTLSGKIYKRHFDGSVKSENLIQTLEHVQRQIPGKIIVIWDRASIHLSKVTKAHLQKHPEILIEELPAYAPQLNPEEYCHGNVKQRLKNARPANKEEIRSMLDRGFARLRRRPDLLLGFFHAAGLSVRQLRLT
ncbi:MAG: transposase [Anaerolineales bacterium]|nr:MAG: transposase [Anaerolineales bacterium]